ncbi:MAG TPA: hypothetical protein VMX97_07640 [Hyphomicrobiaceae bacterium]|nr:hypothetical protein [Hyphomicrobiaceae bacterium]
MDSDTDTLGLSDDRFRLHNRFGSKNPFGLRYRFGSHDLDGLHNRFGSSNPLRSQERSLGFGKPIGEQAPGFLVGKPGALPA